MKGMLYRAGLAAVQIPGIALAGAAMMQLFDEVSRLGTASSPTRLLPPDRWEDKGRDPG